MERPPEYNLTGVGGHTIFQKTSILKRNQQQSPKQLSVRSGNELGDHSKTVGGSNMISKTPQSRNLSGINLP